MEETVDIYLSFMHNTPRIGVSAEPRYPSSRPSPAVDLGNPTNKIAGGADYNEGFGSYKTASIPFQVQAKQIIL